MSAHRKSFGILPKVPVVRIVDRPPARFGPLWVSVIFPSDQSVAECRLQMPSVRHRDRTSGCHLAGDKSQDACISRGAERWLFLVSIRQHSVNACDDLPGVLDRSLALLDLCQELLTFFLRFFDQRRRRIEWYDLLVAHCQARIRRGLRSAREAAMRNISSLLLATLRRTPPVDHRSSNQLCSLTGASNDSFRAFDARRVNGDSPFVSFDPSANRVPDPPVLHGKPFRATKD